ncbi:hypothetical protein [Flaviflexus huanghaiensis]|uniref:hypothetical protein n=1 Tax=Flaviflexus huanghaiensis TaxID=1111473 RepID=UPI0015FA957C|nr:hypothetical protein [Flaviflexus huanghaiensis]
MQSLEPVIYVDRGPDGMTEVRPVQRLRRFHMEHRHVAHASCDPVSVPVTQGRVRLWVDPDAVPDTVTVSFFRRPRRALMFPLEIDAYDLTGGDLHAEFGMDGAKQSIVFTVPEECAVLRVTASYASEERVTDRYVLKLEG